MGLIKLIIKLLVLPLIVAVPTVKQRSTVSVRWQSLPPILP